MSRSHVERAVAGGFTQANHGKPGALRRMHRDDAIVFYSAKTDYPDGDALQAFTALGHVSGDDVYQVESAPDFRPWRRDVHFADVTETPIRPLLEDLDFVVDTARWGYKFRFGVFEISEHDFDVLEQAMTP